MSTRKAIPLDVKKRVLTEAGYRCAVPTCRGILALDLHHLAEVSQGGGNKPDNLIALCPTCHALHHRGTISVDSLRVYKGILLALLGAFDYETIDKLMFLQKPGPAKLVMSGDGVVTFYRLVAADLAAFQMLANNSWQIVTYEVLLTAKGENLLNAWKAGNLAQVEAFLGAPPTTQK